jgi:hypothetical protein
MLFVTYSDQLTSASSLSTTSTTFARSSITSTVSSFRSRSKLDVQSLFVLFHQCLGLKIMSALGTSLDRQTDLVGQLLCKLLHACLFSSVEDDNAVDLVQ